MRNLREKQISLLGQIFSLRASDEYGSPSDFVDEWKVLVYDSCCRDIISPAMNVGSLRELGVTLHMMIESDREPVPDAPAVYFVRPTPENIARIAQDAKKQLYRNFHLNFVTQIERPLMEKLASDVVASGSSARVARLLDQYLDLIVLEPGLFTLNIANSFRAYNERGVTEAQIRAYIKRVSAGLLSLVRVHGCLPYIRAPPGGAAEMLAADLDSTLREHTSSKHPAASLFSGRSTDGPQARPLLLILDRSQDLGPPLLHTSSYQGLMDDLLDHKLNRVVVEIPPKSGSDASTSTRKTYDLNSASDAFFRTQAAAPFPVAVEANEKELEAVCAREAQIRSGRRTTPETSAEPVSGNGEAELSEAIATLPHILARKAGLEAHTSILQAVMRNVASRDVPSFFEVEQKLLSDPGSAQRAAVLDLLRDGSKGNTTDKLRLLLFSSVLAGTSPALQYDSDFEDAFTEGAKATGATSDSIAAALAAVKFTQQLQKLQQPLGGSAAGLGASGQLGALNGSSGGLSSLLSTASTAAGGIFAKAAALFSKPASLHVTRVVEAMAAGRACAEQDSFGCLDPQTKAGSTSAAAARNRPFSEVIVFVLGGGCYTEYFNLLEMQHQQQQQLQPPDGGLQSIVYGGSELCSPEGFLAQLQALAGSS